MQRSIVGVWRLRSFHAENVDTKERSNSFGLDPRGTLILHPDGRMVALITPGTSVTPEAEAHRADGPQKLIAYSGLYRLEPPDRFVTAVDIAWMPAWVGTDQARTYTLDGDELEIVSAPGPMRLDDGSEATFVGVLQWNRETPISARIG